MQIWKNLTKAYTKQIFVFLFSGPTNEPLFVVQITGKGVAQEDISHPYGHFVS